MLRRVLCALAGIALVALAFGDAYGTPVYPSQHQVDQAKQAAAAKQAAVNAVQAQYNAAEQQLSQLTIRAQQAAQQYDAATSRLAQAQLAAQQAGIRVDKADDALRQAKDQLGMLVASSYRDDNGMAALSMFLNAVGPEQLAEATHLIEHQAVTLKSVVNAATTAQQDATSAHAAAVAAVAEQQTAEQAVAAAAAQAQAAVNAEQTQTAALNAQRTQLLAELAAAQHTSVTLEQERQQGLAAAAAARASQGHSSGGSGGLGNSPGYDAGLASQALAYAYAQLGKPYLWGGTGPSAFDCSGLAMRAWESAGIMLPHYAAFQYQASHPLSYSELRPGDLLFWATDPDDSDTIYHEAIYIGNQQMIQAPMTGEFVEISNMWMWGPIAFYARPY